MAKKALRRICSHLIYHYPVKWADGEIHLRRGFQISWLLEKKHHPCAAGSFLRTSLEWTLTRKGLWSISCLGPQLNTLQSWEGLFPAAPKGVSERRREEKHTEQRELPWWLKWERTCPKCMRAGFDPWVGKIPCRRKWQTAPVFLPGKCHGQRSLAGYIPWVTDSRTQLSVQIHTHTHSIDVRSWKPRVNKARWVQILRAQQ